jgi:hypothetical protein
LEGWCALAVLEDLGSWREVRMSDGDSGLAFEIEREAVGKEAN